MQKRDLLVSGIVIGLGVLLYFLFSVKKQEKKDGFAIAIVQSATHPALDNARQGFIDTVTEFAPETLFIVKNGERSVSTLHAIMDELETMDYVDLLYAIATPALSAVAKREQKRPIVFTAVTDPTILHLEARSNVCGVTDAVDEASVLRVVFDLFSPKRIAILFDPAEANSVLSKNRIVTYAKDHSVFVSEYGVSSVLDIQTVLEHMTDIDCVVLPTDNLLASAITLVTRILKEKHIPCITLFPVTEDVALYAGVDYYSAGCEVARMAISILKGEKNPNDFGFMRDEKQIVHYNEDVLTSLGVTVPEKN